MARTREVAIGKTIVKRMASARETAMTIAKTICDGDVDSNLLAMAIALTMAIAVVLVAVRLRKELVRSIFFPSSAAAAAAG